jgi:hypothetical protein
MIAILLAQAAIPLLLVVWMMFWPARSVAGIVVQMIGSLVLLLALIRVGIWLFPPWWTPHAAAGLVVLSAAWHAGRARRSVPIPFGGRYVVRGDRVAQGGRFRSKP